MRFVLSIFCSVFFLANCSNSNDNSPIQTALLDFLDTLQRPENANARLDARKLVTRQKIDQSGMAVLFIELESGHNGTLILYPGQNVGEVWLGLDGATVILDKGFLVATRGMGDDLMSTSTKFFSGLKSNEKPSAYQRTYRWLREDNRIMERTYRCRVFLKEVGKRIAVFNEDFVTDLYGEACDANASQIKNSYYLDDKGMIRRSYQYHSPTLGHVLIERLDSN